MIMFISPLWYLFLLSVDECVKCVCQRERCWTEIVVLTSLSAPARVLDVATLLVPHYRRTATHGGTHTPIHTHITKQCIQIRVAGYYFICTHSLKLTFTFSVCHHGSWECTNEGCPGKCEFVTFLKLN